MRILFPTDGSRYALAVARALSGWFVWPGGEVDLLAVTSPKPKSDHRDFGKDSAIDQEWRATAGRWLADTASHLDGSGLRVAELVRPGHAAEIALEAAADGYDLVAVGAKGRGATPFFDRDGVPRALLEGAPTSVLLVRERTPRGRRRRQPTSQHPLRVLLAVDGRPPSQAAVEACSTFMAADHVIVSVLTVADSVAGGLLATADARHVARRVTATLRSRGITADPQVAEGEIAREILEAAASTDLIVMGARDTHEPTESRMGSVGLEVALRSPCSLLIVRAAGAVAPAELEMEPGSTTAIEITYENMEPSPVAERHVLRGVRRLERLSSGLIRVRVTLAERHRRHRTGNLYDVHLELTVPGPDVVVSRTPPRHRESEDLVTAIGAAFDKALRVLVERDRVGRGEVKAHEPEGRGEVTSLFPDYGFIQSEDGREVYFHRNSVVGSGWGELVEGSQVRFVDELGEEGPQATTVKVSGRHRTVA